MFGNGVGIGIIVHIIVVVQVAIRGDHIMGLAASFVAAVGTSTMAIAVWLFATTVVLVIVTALWGFAL